ncbi:MAG TPA: PIN domain-containing protein [Tepidisphaeraceae bacterium]|jgi:PIN domain nuclease of toxin-antitoxin system
MFDGYVVDAHALIWHLEGNPKLGSAARLVMSDPGANLFLPAIALAEACYIVETGRVMIKSGKVLLHAVDRDPRVQIVPLDRGIIETCLSVRTVSEMHDRQIVATAVHLATGGLTVAILTKDADISASGAVPVIW